MNAPRIFLPTTGDRPRISHCGLLGAMLIFMLGFSTVLGAEPAEGAKAVVSSPDYNLPEDPHELLRLDAEMKTFFAARIDRTALLETRLDEIIKAILGEKGLHFSYEGDGVYDVREAFRRRRGNCLTYSLLVVAVAREFGIKAEFNEVFIVPRWNRSGGIIIESRHINVRVEAPDGYYEIDLKDER
jgi:Transglutaminase-like superfamily